VGLGTSPQLDGVEARSVCPVKPNGFLPERVPHPKEAGERTPDATQGSVNTALLMIYYHHRR